MSCDQDMRATWTDPLAVTERPLICQYVAALTDLAAMGENGRPFKARERWLSLQCFRELPVCSRPALAVNHVSGINLGSLGSGPAAKQPAQSYDNPNYG